MKKQHEFDKGKSKEINEKNVIVLYTAIQRKCYLQKFFRLLIRIPKFSFSFDEITPLVHSVSTSTFNHTENML